MSLADELLADLEEEGIDDAEQEESKIEIEDVSEVQEVSMDVDTKANTIFSIAKLRDSEQLQDVLDKMEFFSKKGARDVTGPVESDPEYMLIVDANNLINEIDNEVSIIHKFVRDKYHKRFPELESLVVLPIDYIKTVKELGNTIDISKNNQVLMETLTPATIMVVSVTASTTQGQEMTKDEQQYVTEACDMAIDLMNHKETIYEYVESRMAFIAPNLSTIVGASTAAKLMGVAGGLTNLSKMPACNVLVLGSQKKTLSGFSNTVIMPHTGFVYFSPIVQNTPTDLRKKAARLVASKCTLAARVDAFNEESSVTIGEKLKAEIDEKLDKLQEPPPVKAIKALAAPIEPGRKKRGGRRYRKMKERLGLTEMRKQANRMNFGMIEEDAYQDDLNFTLGNLGKSGSGRVRGPVIDSKTKAKISKTLHQKMQKQQTWGGSTTVKKHVSGTASSVAFTPLQGLEIVNPQAAETRIKEANQKYFSTTSGFRKVAKE